MPREYSQRVASGTDSTTESIRRVLLSVEDALEIVTRLFSGETVFLTGPILRHHDYRSLQRSSHGKHKVQEDVRIRIPLRAIWSMSDSS